MSTTELLASPPYKREAWIVQSKTARSLLLLPNPGLHPMVTFLMAEETRLFCRRTVEG